MSQTEQLQRQNAPRPQGLLALDIDGTICGPDGNISARTQRAIAAAHAAGWLILLATGRRWKSTRAIARQLGLQTPLIIYNGAVIRDVTTSTLLHYSPLPDDLVGPLVQALVDRGLQPILCEDIRQGERYFTGPSDLDDLSTSRWIAEVTAEYGPIVQRLPYEELAQVRSVVRIITYHQTADLRRIESLADDCPPGWRMLRYAHDQYDCDKVELLHAGSTKGLALIALANRYGIPLTDTIAVGDDYNDLDLLETASIGVAMAQAPQPVRACATLTIGSCEDEGLATFIETELLTRAGFPEHLRRSSETTMRGDTSITSLVR